LFVSTSSDKKKVSRVEVEVSRVDGRGKEVIDKAGRIP
jgi:hypothetical protein